VRLWNPATGKELRQIKMGGQRDMEMRFRNVMGMQGGMGMMGMGMSMFPSAFSPDSRVLALVNVDNKVRLWETATGKERRSWRVNQSGVSVLAFSPDGSLLATGSPDETVRLWDTLNGKLVRGCVGHRGRIQAIAFSPDAKLLATGSEDHVVRIWEVG